MAITDFLAKNFFPEGNLQQIKAQSLSPREYNIRATEDQIQNMFGGRGGILKDIIAPAATFGLSLPYDTGQGIVRAFNKFQPDTGILDYDAIPSGPTFKDIGASIAAERPLSSAYERMIGASSGLTNRFQGLRDLFNASALAKEGPMSIEDFQVQNIEDRPVDSISSNFLNDRFQEDRTPIKDKALDFLGSGKELALRGIGSIIGGPVGSFIGSALGKLKTTPEQKTVKGLYDLDSIGRVQSGIMQGYNPVSLFGPTGLSGAMIDRITKINDTLNNPKISQAVKDRLEARKAELQAKIKREQAAVRKTIEQQYRKRPGEYGGRNRQIEREQAGPGYDKVSESGSF